MLRSDHDDKRSMQKVDKYLNNEEEKKESSSTSSLETESSGSEQDVELTSNLAFDRFLSIGAYGYANGQVKLIKVNPAVKESSL